MSDAKNTRSKKRGLGRGLSALMDDVGMDTIIDGDAKDDQTPNTKKTPKKAPKKPASKTKPAAKKPAPKTDEIPETTASKNAVNFVAIDQLTRNPDQPRRYFDKERLEELTDSIRAKGVLQPILVRVLPDSAREQLKGDAAPAFQIIAGERRWQAALKAGLEAVPVFVREITDREALEIGVVENVHRADLNPMEEAGAYQSLLTQFGLQQDEVAGAVGKSRPYITNMLRLLNLPESVRQLLAEGKITTGHARALIAMPDPAKVAELIITRDLSVRQVENLARSYKQGGADLDPLQALKPDSSKEKHADIRYVEEQLTNALGLIVDLRDKGGKGELRLKYKKPDQLEALIQRLMKG